MSEGRFTYDEDGLVTATATELGHVSGVTSAIQTQLNAKQDTITGGASTIANTNLTANRALISNAEGKVEASPVTSTELGYVSGVASSIQTQLNNKQETITGAASTIASSDLAISRALASDTDGKVTVSSATSTELSYLSGVTSAVQTQLNNKQDGLVSGTNIKTINGKSIVGPGNLTVSGGLDEVDEKTITLNENEAIQTVGILNDLDSSTLKVWSGTKTQYEALKQNINWYAWAYNSSVYFTTSATPSVDDAVYDSDRIATNYKVESVSSNTIEINNTLETISCTRDATQDFAGNLIYSNKVYNINDIEHAYADLSNLTPAGESHFQAPITGGASTITSNDLTASHALVSNASGKVDVSSATSTELGYLSGVTSAVQTQLNGKADTDLSNLSSAGEAKLKANIQLVNELPVDQETGVLYVIPE